MEKEYAVDATIHISANSKEEAMELVRKAQLEVNSEIGADLLRSAEVTEL